MTEPRDITLDRGWIIMVRDIGIDPRDALLRARLSTDLLNEESSRLTVSEHFRLLAAVEDLAQDPMLPFRLAGAASPESFSPPIFAALCSSTLSVAVSRIAAHKRLIAPMQVTHTESEEGFVVAWAWDDPTLQSPRLLIAMELIFMTQIARIATREPIQPLRVSCPIPLEPTRAFHDFFGVAPTVSEETSLTFRREDAHRPFLTASESLWKSFEPELQRRLSKLQTETPMAERTRSMLLECLPGGEATLDGTARRLGVSARTLQRRLADENVTFRALVQRTRERLARHYLVHTSVTYGEVAFLLGFDEASSFFRAFREWTGHTPEFVRRRG